MSENNSLGENKLSENTGIPAILGEIKLSLNNVFFCCVIYKLFLPILN